MSEPGSMTSKIRGAPICTGGASPLRVATGGNANWGSKPVAAARPPAQIDGAVGVVGVPKKSPVLPLNQT